MTSPTPAQETVDRLKPYVLDLLGTDARDQAQQALADTEAIRDAVTGQITSALDAVPGHVAAGMDEHAATTASAVAGWTADAVGGRNLIVRRDEEANSWVDTEGNVGYRKDSALTTIPVSPGETFTFTKSTSEVELDGGFFRYGWYDEEGALVFRTASASNEIVVTVPARAAVLKVSYPIDSFPKVERGSRSTGWTPAPEDAALHVQAGNPLSSFPSPFPAHDPALALRVDNSVGTRVFVGDTMIQGDTGWRNITAEVTNGWVAGSMVVRRIGSMVDFRVSGLDATDAAGNTFLYMPQGFMPGPGEKLALFIKHIATHGSSPQMSTGDTTGTINSIFRSSVTTRFTEGSFSITYFTSEPWPTTLPGTPA